MQSLSFKVLREAVERYEVNAWKARFVVPVESVCYYSVGGVTGILLFITVYIRICTHVIVTDEAGNSSNQVYIAVLFSRALERVCLNLG